MTSESRDLLDRSKKLDKHAEEARITANAAISSYNRGTIKAESVQYIRQLANFSNVTATWTEEGLCEHSHLMTEEEKKQKIDDFHKYTALTKAFEAAADRLEAELKRSGG